MSYRVIKGVKQLEVEGKDIDNNIYLPLEALWDDYTILKDQRVIFIDSPLNGIEVGLLDVSGSKGKTNLDLLKDFLAGAGCKVHVLDEADRATEKVNLVLVVNTDEGVFQTGYGGFKLNGSKKLAGDIGWALARFFELDYVAPPVKEKEYKKTLKLWKKVTTPLVYIKSRSGADDEFLLAISVLMGLFRFATKTLPIIDEKIFSAPLPPIIDGKGTDDASLLEVVENPEGDIQTEELQVKDQRKDLLIEEEMEKEQVKSATMKKIAIKSEDVDLGAEEDDLNSREVDIMSKKGSKRAGKGRMVTDPSPKLKAHMKKIIAEQHAKAEKEKKAPANKGTEYAAKLAGLGKG